MPTAVFGTAHLFGATPEAASHVVLDAAWGAGFRAYDTAPLYGHGRSEAELGAQLARWGERPQVTSKVGLAPSPPEAGAKRFAKSLARRLPGPVQDRLRSGGDAPRGDFDPATVRASVETTLRRLGRVDRLMLHEAHAADLTDEVLELLATFHARGDVGQVGVATVNAAALAVVRRAPELVTAAHLEVGPYATPVDLPATVTTVVGHGVLGPAASGLHRLAASVATGGPAATRWRAVTDGTRWSGDAGLADALVARAAALPLTDVIVATSRPERLGNLRDLAARAVRMPDDVDTALAGLVLASQSSAPAA